MKLHRISGVLYTISVQPWLHRGALKAGVAPTRAINPSRFRGGVLNYIRFFSMWRCTHDSNVERSYPHPISNRIPSLSVVQQSAEYRD